MMVEFLDEGSRNGALRGGVWIDNDDFVGSLKCVK